MRLVLLLFLVWNLKIASQEPHRSVYFKVESFEHVTRRYPSNICCWEETDRETCTSCPISFHMDSNFGNFHLGVDRRRIDYFNVDKVLSYTTDVRYECTNISIVVQEYYTLKLIDIWRVTCLNLRLGENYTVRSELGSFKNMKASFNIWWECVGFAGPNCVKECTPNSRSYCDRDGDLRCKDGFAGPPDCRLNSPCINSICRNGGNCVALSTRDYTCECSPLYTGKNCEIARCDPLKCAGRCENGECVCTSDKVDPTCTSFSCEGNFLCKNNGTCGTLNGETFCVCPSLTSGAYCQFYCPEGCVNGRCEGDSKGNSVCQCFPNFVGETCEIGLNGGDDPASSSTAKGLSLEAIISIVFATIFGLLSVSLLIKFIYDRYNINIIDYLANKKISKGSDLPVDDP